MLQSTKHDWIIKQNFIYFNSSILGIRGEGDVVRIKHKHSKLAANRQRRDRRDGSTTRVSFSLCEKKTKRKKKDVQPWTPSTRHRSPAPPQITKQNKKKQSKKSPPPETPSPAWLCTRQVQEEATGSASVRCQSLRPTERQRAPNSVPGEEEGEVGGGLGWGGFL